MDNYKFKEFAQMKGYPLPNNFNYSIGVGELERFKDVNKNKTNTDLWIKNIDNNIFVFGDWKTGEKYTYIDDSNNQYNYDDRKEVSYKLQQQKQAELHQKKELANQLERYYLSLPKADNHHKYLVDKNIFNHEAVRQDGDNLVIPCMGIDEPFKGKLQSIQKISLTGFKQFYKGANARSSYLCLNKSSNDGFIFVEGFATGVSVLEMVQHFKTDVSVIVCFNCNNLKRIVTFFYDLYPAADFNILADNDLNGVGIRKANEVAAIIPNVSINPPPLTDEQKQQGLSDWNDYFVKVRGGRFCE